MNGIIRIGLVFIGLLCAIFVYAQGQIIAHRGASSIAPENTLAAFTAAIDRGADYIEADVRLSKDDSLMVIHDETIDRTTNGSGTVDQFSYDQLRSFSAGYQKKFGVEFIDEKIPTLFEVLKLAKGKVRVCIDVKNTPEGPILALIGKLNMKSDVALMSYNIDKLKRINFLDAGIKTVFIKNTLTTPDLKLATETGAYAVSCWYGTPLLFIKEAHRKELNFWSGVVSDPAIAANLFKYGVDAVITGLPQLMTMDNQKMVNVAPNPFNEFVTIRLEKPETVKHILILNTVGQIVGKFSGPWTNPIEWGRGPEISPGIYCIYVIGTENYSSEKVLKIQ